MSAAATSNTTRTTGLKHRVVDIEQALRWAYQSELPKKREDRAITGPAPASVHPMWRAGVFGGRIDCWNRDPGFPLAMGEPHPDALAIDEELRLLKAEDLDLSGYDIGRGLGPDCDVDRVVANQVERFAAKGALAALLITHTIRNKRPDLGEGPMCEAGKGSRGQVTLWIKEQVEVGQDASGTPMYVTTDRTTTPVRAGQYRPGTFCKLHWVRNANDVAEDRAVYAIWHAALIEIRRRLTEGTRMDVDANGRPIEVPLLRYLTIKPPVAPATPWIADPTPPTPRVLPGLNTTAEIAKPRVVALTPRAVRNSPVRWINPASLPAAA